MYNNIIQILTAHEGNCTNLLPKVTGDRGLLYRPMVSSQQGELFCTIFQLKSSQYLFYITHKNVLSFYIFFEEETVETISQNVNPDSQMPVLEARRPSPSLGLVKLSSKSNNQIQQLNL